MSETKPRRQKDGAPIWARTILSLMEQRRITNHELAKHVGLTPQAVSYMISGRPDGKYPALKPEVLTRICQFFGVSSDFILGLSQTASLNPKVQALCKGLGLSEKAVRNLSDIGANKSGQSVYSTDGKGAYALGYSVEGNDSMAKTISIVLEDKALLHLLHEYMVELPDDNQGVFADMKASAIMKLIETRLASIRAGYQAKNIEILQDRKDPKSERFQKLFESKKIGFKIEADQKAMEHMRTRMEQIRKRKEDQDG